MNDTPNTDAPNADAAPAASAPPPQKALRSEGIRLEDIPQHFDGSMLMNRGIFDQIALAAGVFSRSDLVPAHFRGKSENCFIAFQMALRMKMDPFMLMQNLYVVKGRPGFEAKFLIAQINTSGLYTDPLDFEFDDEKNPTECTAYAVRKSTGKRQSARCTIKMAKDEGWWGKDGSKWPTLTEQMLIYRSASFFAKRFCPELGLGMQTVEELRDMDAIDITPLTQGNAAELSKLLQQADNAPENVNMETGEVIEAEVMKAPDAEVRPKQEPKAEAPKQQGLSGLSRIKQHAAKQ